MRADNQQDRTNGDLKSHALSITNGGFEMQFFKAAKFNWSDRIDVRTFPSHHAPTKIKDQRIDPKILYFSEESAHAKTLICVVDAKAIVLISHKVNARIDGEDR
ncbi:hypothetical protein D3C87_1467760 [compost metagenome]